MALTPEVVLAAVSAHLDEVRRLGVRRLGLFGSTARGEAGPDSDLDFLVELDRKSFDAYMGLKLFLSDPRCPRPRD